MTSKSVGRVSTCCNAMSAMGSGMVVIGTHFGRAVGFPAGSAPLPPSSGEMDGLLRSLATSRFLIDLRELPGEGGLHDWFQALHETREDDGTAMVAPLEAYNAILFLDTITPTPPATKQ